MRFTSLHLAHFRSYTSASVTFPDAPGTIVFLGENGVGKTNVIEAFSLLSLSRSCKGSDEAELVQWDQPFYRLTADTTADDGTVRRLEVVSEITPRKRKALFVNDVRTPAASFVGITPSVTFLPQDLLLFSGPPAERRRFLDQLLSQVSPEYLTALARYQQVLQQRNALLRTLAETNGDRSVLDVWDRELARAGSVITRLRLELIETFLLSFHDELRQLGETWNTVALQYDRKTQAHAEGEIEEEFMRILRTGRDRDIVVQATLAGPHREDWRMLVDGRDLPSVASRGQERTAVLALLLLQVSYMQLKRGETPVLLLDDAFSELDDRHQRLLLDSIPGAQVFLTALRLPPQAQPRAVFDIAPGVIAEGSA